MLNTEVKKIGCKSKITPSLLVPLVESVRRHSICSTTYSTNASAYIELLKIPEKKGSSTDISSATQWQRHAKNHLIYLISFMSCFQMLTMCLSCRAPSSTLEEILPFAYCHWSCSLIHIYHFLMHLPLEYGLSTSLRNVFMLLLGKHPHFYSVFLVKLTRNCPCRVHNYTLVDQCRVIGRASIHL